MSEKTGSPAVTANITQLKEKILYETRPMALPALLTFENLGLFGIIFVVAVAAVVFHLGGYELLIISLIWLIVAFPSLRTFFSSNSTTYVLTNQRFVIFSVSFKNSEQSIPLSEIQSAVCKPSGLQRFYGAGDIIIYRKGLRKPIRLHALKNCKQFTSQILKAIKSAS